MRPDDASLVLCCSGVNYMQQHYYFAAYIFSSVLNYYDKPFEIPINIF